MNKSTKYLLYSLNAVMVILLLICFWPIGILALINFIILLIATGKKGDSPLETRINQTAGQFGIQYGTPEEKLEQLAAIAARAQEPKSITEKP